ncbi:hypothetical protein BDN70DRAFT_803119, partial [Pholiota conissans]
NRDVIINMVDKYSPDYPEGSTELQILRLLNSPSMRSDPRNATVPILEFIEFHGWVFAVMPTYGECDTYYFLSSHECMDFACQSSEDISHENITMNYRGTIPRKYQWGRTGAHPILVLPEFYSTFPVKYSLIDFGYSAYFLPDLHRSKCRVVPLRTARLHRAPEVDGYSKSDPFAADVYQTATLLYSYFGVCSNKNSNKVIDVLTIIILKRIIHSEVPGLLELLQDMLSRHAPDRISMAVAARQIRGLYKKLPPHECLPRHAIEVEDYYCVPRSRCRYFREYLRWFFTKKRKLLLVSLQLSPLFSFTGSTVYTMLFLGISNL